MGLPDLAYYEDTENVGVKVQFSSRGSIAKSEPKDMWPDLELGLLRREKRSTTCAVTSSH